MDRREGPVPCDATKEKLFANCDTVTHLFIYIKHSVNAGNSLLFSQVSSQMFCS